MKIERILLIGTSLLFCGLWLKECKSSKDLIKAIEDVQNVKTDTIYSDNPYQKPEDLPISNKPNDITIYPKPKPDTIYVKEVEIKKDTIRLYYNETGKLDINKDYLFQYPEAPKLLNFELSKDYMKFDLLDISGSIIGRGYSINTDYFNYVFNGNSLSSKIISEPLENGFKNHFGISTSYSYRPLPNFHDIYLNLDFETKNFIYTVGVNGYLYPHNKGITPNLKITYKIWQGKN